MAPGYERLHEADRPVALEDPVRRHREDEQDADEHLERGLRHLESGVDELGTARQPPQPLLETAEDLALDTGRLTSLLMERGRRRCRLHLVNRARHEEPQNDPHDQQDREVVQEHARRPGHVCAPS